MKRAKIKSIPYEEFKDNETYEELVEQLNAGGANVIVRKLDDLIDWGRSNSLLAADICYLMLWYRIYGRVCCTL